MLNRVTPHGPWEAPTHLPSVKLKQFQSAQKSQNLHRTLCTICQGLRSPVPAPPRSGSRNYLILENRRAKSLWTPWRLTSDDKNG